MERSERWAFFVDWFDANAGLTRQYTLFYFPATKEVEMIDNKSRRSFLRRTKADNLSQSMLTVGSSFNLLGRQLTITEYADEHTRKVLDMKTEKAVAIINEQGFQRLGDILTSLTEQGNLLLNMQMINVTAQGQAALSEVLEVVERGRAVIIEFTSDHLTDTLAKARSASSAFCSTLGQDSAEIAKSLCFGDHRFPTTAVFNGTTLGVIKPHAVLDGNLGRIISDILGAGFDITAVQAFNLNRADTEEFLEVYKGVVPEYTSMVTELESGICVALEIATSSGPSHKDFRDFVGPMDPEIARHLRSHTLRAKYGHSKVQNAVHCTDLPEDAELETEYFFSILLE